MVARFQSLHFVNTLVYTYITVEWNSLQIFLLVHSRIVLVVVQCVSLVIGHHPATQSTISQQLQQ